MDNRTSYKIFNDDMKRLYLFLLEKWLPSGIVNDGRFIYTARNPRSKAAGNNLVVCLITGRWLDTDTGDGGEDIYSLCAFLFNMSPRKATLHIFDMVKASYGQ